MVFREQLHYLHLVKMSCFLNSLENNLFMQICNGTHYCCDQTVTLCYVQCSQCPLSYLDEFLILIEKYLNVCHIGLCKFDVLMKWLYGAAFLCYYSCIY